jgi:type IV pilus assembly protein PilM
MQIDLGALLRKEHQFFGLDIGQSSVKFMEITKSESSYTVSSIAKVSVTGDLFNNQLLTNSDKFSAAFSEIQKNKNLSEKKAVIGLPGPSVFTKRIKINRPDSGDLKSHIMFEAGNVLPQGNQGVKVDYHILKSSTKESLDVLLVAVRNEIIDSYLDTVMLTGVNVGIADVDFFALQNCFEINYPEYFDSTCVLIDVGHRFCSLVITQCGECLSTSDVTISNKDPIDFASELGRAIKFLWGSLSGDGKIDRIFLAGGNSSITGLAENLSTKSGVPVEILNPFKTVSCPHSFEGGASQYSIALGLAIRKFGDRNEVNEE